MHFSGFTFIFVFLGLSIYYLSRSPTLPCVAVTRFFRRKLKLKLSCYEIFYSALERHKSIILQINYPLVNNQRCYSFWFIIQTYCKATSIICNKLCCNLSYSVLYLKSLDMFSVHAVLIYLSSPPYQ